MIPTPRGTCVRSLHYPHPYGYIEGWDNILQMVIIRWEGIADHGPEACESHEYRIIQGTYEKKLLQALGELDESIAIEQAIDNMHRKEIL
jgi:hypothetical protein